MPRPTWISRKPSIDLSCAGLQTLSMTTTGAKATGQFTLALDPDNDRGRPSMTATRSCSPTPTATASAGRSDITSTSIRDLPPEIEIVEPEQEEVEVAEDGQLRIRVHAFDPDYGLRHVTLQAERERKSARRRNWACRCSWTAPSRTRHGRSVSTAKLSLPARRSEVEGRRHRALLGHRRG